MKSSDFTILFAEDNVGIQKVYEKNFVKGALGRAWGQGDGGVA